MQWKHRQVEVGVKEAAGRSRSLWVFVTMQFSTEWSIAIATVKWVNDDRLKSGKAGKMEKKLKRREDTFL